MCTKTKYQNSALRQYVSPVTLSNHLHPRRFRDRGCTSVAGLPELSYCFRWCQRPRRALSSEQQRDPHSAHDYIQNPVGKRMRLRPLWVAATISQGASQTGRHRSAEPPHLYPYLYEVDSSWHCQNFVAQERPGTLGCRHPWASLAIRLCQGVP